MKGASWLVCPANEKEGKPCDHGLHDSPTKIDSHEVLEDGGTSRRAFVPKNRMGTGMAVHATLRSYIKAQWEVSKEDLFTDLRIGNPITSAPSNEVRKFMLEWLNAPQEKKNKVNRDHWQSLTLEARAAVLLEVFPDGEIE